MILTLLASLLACTQGEDGVDFDDLPADLAPIAKNTAEFPADESETLNTVVGTTGGTDWVHGRGYVHADLETTWSALADPLVVLDRRMVSEYEVTLDNRPEYAVSFKTTNVVPNIITIEFDVDWWQDEVSEGRVAGRYEKTDGSPVISRMEGGFVLTPIAEELTAIEVIGELEATQRGTDPVLSYWSDVYGDVVAFSHGEDLPELD